MEEELEELFEKYGFYWGSNGHFPVIRFPGLCLETLEIPAGNTRFSDSFLKYVDYNDNLRKKIDPYSTRGRAARREFRYYKKACVSIYNEAASSFHPHNRNEVFSFLCNVFEINGWGGGHPICEDSFVAFTGMLTLIDRRDCELSIRHVEDYKKRIKKESEEFSWNKTTWITNTYASQVEKYGKGALPEILIKMYADRIESDLRLFDNVFSGKFCGETEDKPIRKEWTVSEYNPIISWQAKKILEKYGFEMRFSFDSVYDYFTVLKKYKDSFEFYTSFHIDAYRTRREKLIELAGWLVYSGRDKGLMLEDMKNDKEYMDMMWKELNDISNELCMEADRIGREEQWT